MQLELNGKKALITGASRGIGRSIAEVLHREGCTVALNARGIDELNIAVSELENAVAIVGDVTRPEEAQRIVDETTEKLGQIDILICNVGSGRSVHPGTETHAEWQRVFECNLWSTTNIIEATRQTQMPQGSAIVCISSICGHEVIPGAPVTYSVAKAALNAYVRAIAKPLGKKGIRINAVAPGNILFEGSVWSRKLSEDSVAVAAMLEQDVPMNRLGTPGDVAELVAYLGSPRASFVTGSVWTLDGGQVRS